MTEVCHLSQNWEALTAAHLQNYDPVGFLLIPLYVPSTLEATGEAFSALTTSLKGIHSSHWESTNCSHSFISPADCKAVFLRGNPIDFRKAKDPITTSSI